MQRDKSQDTDRSSACWVVCDDGKVGTENQCVGLASALGFQPRVVRLTARFPWRALPPSLWFSPLSGLSSESALRPPWPRLIIAAGRLSVAPTAFIRRASQGKTFVVQLQNPRIHPAAFDAVVAPAHDQLPESDHVIVTDGALHQVTSEKLAREAKKFAPLVQDLPKPIVTVLMGGSNRCYQMTPGVVKEFSAALKAFALQHQVGLAITPSRRTDPKALQILREGLKDTPTYIWDQTGENPFFGLLGLAETLIVTCDSVSMISEACFTGNPVYIYHLPGGSKKFMRFHALFEAKGYTRPFDGGLEKWTHPSLDDQSKVVAVLKERLASH